MINLRHRLSQGLTAVFWPRFGTKYNPLTGEALELIGSPVFGGDYIDFEPNPSAFALRYGDHPRYYSKTYSVLVDVVSSIDSGTTTGSFPITNAANNEQFGMSWSNLSSFYTRSWRHWSGAWNKCQYDSGFLVKDRRFVLGVTYDDGMMKIFADGHLHNYATGLADPIQFTGPLDMGSANQGFNGKLYKAFVYNRALSDSDMREMSKNPEGILWRRRRIFVKPNPPLAYQIAGAHTITVTSAATLEFTANHAIAGSQTITVTSAAALQYNSGFDIAGYHVITVTSSSFVTFFTTRVESINLPLKRMLQAHQQQYMRVTIMQESMEKYGVNWAAEAGEALLVSSEWASTTGVTMTNHEYSLDATSVAMRAQPGAYILTNRVKMTDGQFKERYIYLTVI